MNRPFKQLWYLAFSHLLIICHLLLFPRGCGNGLQRANDRADIVVGVEIGENLFERVSRGLQHDRRTARASSLALQEAVRRAIVDLFAHKRPDEEFSLALNATKRLWATVKI